MKCWRDLVHECIGNECPMWMEDFEYTDMPGEKEIGLGESKCALALKEKLKVYQSMMDILDAIDITEIDEEEFFRQMAERTREPPRKPSALKGEAKKAVVPAAKKQKKMTPG